MKNEKIKIRKTYSKALKVFKPIIEGPRFLDFTHIFIRIFFIRITGMKIFKF